MSYGFCTWLLRGYVDVSARIYTWVIPCQINRCLLPYHLGFSLNSMLTEDDISINSMQIFSFVSPIVSGILKFKVGREYLSFLVKSACLKKVWTIAISNFRTVCSSYLKFMECILGYENLFYMHWRCIQMDTFKVMASST